MPASDVALGALAIPEASGAAGPWPGVLLVPDVWGLSELYRTFAQRMAAAGFVTLALEPYGGPVRIDDPGRFLREQSDPAMLRRMQAGVDFLSAHPAVSGGRVGVVGFCIGGAYALLAGAALRGLSACVSFYAILSHQHGLLHDPAGLDPERKPQEPLAAAASLRCSFLGLFGDGDEYVPMADVRELERRLAVSGRRAEVRVYPGAGHAFLNETRPQAFRPDAARDAWARMLQFLGEELSAPGPR